MKLPDKIYNKVVFGKPDEALSIEYEKRRAIELGRLKEESIDSLKTNVNEVSGKEVTPKITKKERILEINRDFKGGVYENMYSSFKEAVESKHLDYDYAKQVVYRSG